MTELLLLVDNFDHGTPAVERKAFVFDGIAYTIDLGERMLAEMRADLGRYVAVADKVGPATVTVNGEPLKAHKIRTAAAFTPPTGAADAESNGKRLSATRVKRLPPASPKSAPAFATPPEPEPVTGDGELPLSPLPERATPDQHLPPVSELPPHRSWLVPSPNERIGTGSAQLQMKGRKYRADMRRWLRTKGYAVGVRGHVPIEWVDRYWAACVAARHPESG